MAGRFWARLKWLLHGALMCAATVALGQDVQLSSRDGALSVTGSLISYDGEVYRLDSEFGMLALNAAAVVCAGVGCPDLTAPRAIIRFAGDAAAGQQVLPPLIAAFANAKGLDLRAPSDLGQPTLLLRAGTDIVLAQITFGAATAEAARALQADMQADLVVARFAPAGTDARVLGLDALVPIASPDNSVARISTADLARALSGAVDNWMQIGGPDMPLVLHGLENGSDLAQAVAARLGQTPAFAQTHADLAALAAAVARDPWALAVTGAAEVGPARAIELTDSCNFVLRPSSMAVKTGDYPLTLPIYLLPPPRRLPLMAREFLDFLAMPNAQAAVDAAGFISSNVETAPLIDGARLINAITATADIAVLQRLTVHMQGARRASLTFRFEEGSTDLDAVSQENLRNLALRIEAGQFAGTAVHLVGFGADMDTSMAHATTVLAALTALAPDIGEQSLPVVDAFGAALPMACDTTAAGRRLNARVEVWLRAAAD